MVAPTCPKRFALCLLVMLFKEAILELMVGLEDDPFLLIPAFFVRGVGVSMKSEAS